MRVLILASALLALAACQKHQQQAANESAQSAEAGPQKGVDRSHKGQAAPDVGFSSPDGDDISLGDLSG